MKQFPLVVVQRRLRSTQQVLGLSVGDILIGETAVDLACCVKFSYWNEHYRCTRIYEKVRFGSFRNFLGESELISVVYHMWLQQLRNTHVQLSDMRTLCPL